MNRSLFWPTLTALIMLATLIGLGIWQLERRDEKAQLMSTIASRQAMAEVRLPANLKPLDHWTWRPVQAGCILEGPPAWLIGNSAAGESGFRHIRVCRRIAGPNILVDIGWSRDQRVPMPITIGIPVVGTVLVSDTPGWAARLVQPTPHDHLFFARDLKQMANDLDPKADQLLVVTRVPTPGLQPSATPKLADIPNNHFMYALQWFAFATVLVVVYGLWVSRQLSGTK